MRKIINLILTVLVSAHPLRGLRLLPFLVLSSRRAEQNSARCFWPHNPLVLACQSPRVCPQLSASLACHRRLYQ